MCHQIWSSNVIHRVCTLQFFWTYILHTQHRQHTHGNIIPASLHKQVRGTTKCINSDKGGQNCKISLNLLICFVSSCHLTKPQTRVGYSPGTSEPGSHEIFNLTQNFCSISRCFGANLTSRSVFHVK